MLLLASLNYFPNRGYRIIISIEAAIAQILYRDTLISYPLLVNYIVIFNLGWIKYIFDVSIPIFDAIFFNLSDYVNWPVPAFDVSISSPINKKMRLFPIIVDLGVKLQD